MRVISNVFLNSGGAGDYLRYLEVTEGYRLNYFAHRKRNFLSKAGMLLYNIMYLLFNSDKEIVVYHPQSLTYLLTSIILLSKKHVVIYIIDANFFCYRSYNHYESRSCYECVSRVSIKKDCTAYSGDKSKFFYRIYRYVLKVNAHRVTFYVQSNVYLEKVREMFPKARCVELKKMVPYSIREDFASIDGPGLKIYDFAIHSNYLDAKGASYFLELSKRLVDFKFFASFPNPSEADMFSNVVFYEGRWSEELVNHLSNSKVILHPSLWMRPVEGAYLKSCLLSFSITTKSEREGIGPYNLYDQKYFISGDIIKDSDMLVGLANISKEELDNLHDKQRSRVLNYIGA